MNPLWKTHGPPGLDESRIRLPQETLPALPKTGSGKILKRALREQARGA
jgi:acyl-CoA synthetase (AMP-forming)/AMP-acid ligase II